MGIFEEKKKDTTNAYLAGAGAAAAIPAASYIADYLADNANAYVRDSAKLNKNYSGDITYRNLTRLKEEILKDKYISDNLHVVTSPSNNTYSGVFSDKSKYIPGISQSNLEDMIKNNRAFISVDGSRVSVSDMIKGVRNSGGFIHLGNNDSNIIDLAHELGHARALSTSSKRFGSIPIWLQAVGRTRPSVLAGAASVASLLQEDPDSPYAYAPAAVVAATQIPVLREEYIASKKGYDAIKRLQKAGLLGKGTAQIAKGKYLRYGGSYVAGALAATAVPALVALARQRYGTEVPMLDDARDSISSISPLKAGLLAGGTLLGGAALAKYGPTSKYIDKLINKRMYKGHEIDEAVKKIKQDLNKKS